MTPALEALLTEAERLHDCGRKDCSECAGTRTAKKLASALRRAERVVEAADEYAESGSSAALRRFRDALAKYCAHDHPDATGEPGRE